MANFTLFRLARFIRSIFVPTASIIAFSCILSFVFILYQPTPGPGSIQRLGWQSWEVVNEYVGQSSTAQGVSEDLEYPTAGSNIPDGVDWWNVTTGSDTVDTASLPLDIWDPLMQHDTGREYRPCSNEPLSQYCGSFRDTYYGMHGRPFLRTVHCARPMLSLVDETGRRAQGQMGAR